MTVYASLFCVRYLKKYISFIKNRQNEIYLMPDGISSRVTTYRKAIDTTLKSEDKLIDLYYAGSAKILVKEENDSI